MSAGKTRRSAIKYLLRGALDSLNRGDRKRVTETTRMDKVLDRLDTAIKEYLTSLDSDALHDIDHRRLTEILAFTTNLEHAGDIVEKSLMPLDAKRIKRGVSFSETSRQEIREMIDRLISNARAAAAVFMTEDPGAARQLLGEKEVFERSKRVQPKSTSDGRALPGQKTLKWASSSSTSSATSSGSTLIWQRLPIRSFEGRGELLSSRMKQD
jgi:Na+/phosphate symporter